ncbi:competence protein CoiA [Pseudomonas sp. GCM10022188]|uniref:competence protein CoiA n=1 Tax=Pseudomonas TaxID=286 RepID=UPI001E2EA275|nr:competence protein CoiA [Pseudomonas oryzagri]MCC6073873.1 competence protein CoiA [Pseudomonas oryzagri]
MQDVRIPFGERDGTLFRAFEVENGLACGCICPGCRKPLNAANGGQKVIPHFRHVQSEDCVRGYKEGVRRAAVALIAARRGLTLPAFSRQVSATAVSGHSLFRDVSFQAAPVIGDSVKRFVDLGDVVAHAVVTASNRQLLVRIKVFSRAEHERYQRLLRIEASSVEIDLSGLTFDQINVPAAFERAVLSDPNTRSWIRSLRGEMLIKRAVDELGAEVIVYNAQWEQERTRLQAIEDERRVEQEAKAAEHAAALAAHRQTQLEAAEAQRANGIPVKEERGARERREELIVNQTLRAARDWGGQAVECSACCLLNPPGSEFCLFCTSEASTMTRILVPADIAATIHLRMRSSAKPDRSLRMASTLLVQPDPFT